MRILAQACFGILIFLTGCNPIKITENEDRGIKEVLSTYGGICKYSINWSVNTTSGKQKKFELELSQSEFIDKMQEVRDLFASGIAYAFYKNLNKEEKQEYTKVKVVLVSGDGSKLNYEYDREQLETVQQKMGIAENIAGLIKAKRFNDIKPLLNDSSYYKYDKNELIENIVKAEPQFGNVIEFLPLGFEIFRIDGHNNLHVAGQIKRDKQSNHFSVDMDIDDKQDRAIVINYKL